MSRRLIVRPEAETDILNAAAWYEECESGLGWYSHLKFTARFNVHF